MITLTNGDKWIINNSEINGIDVRGGELPAETPVKEFLHKLVYEESSWPLKLTTSPFPGTSFGKPFWESMPLDGYKIILTDFADKVFETPFCEVFVMPDGIVHVYYCGPDCGGYDCETKRITYASWEEYFAAVLGYAEP